MSDLRIIPVILSGGAGTRLWPLSRAANPKQMHSLGGEATLLQATALRVADAELFDPPIIVCSEALAVEVRNQLLACGVSPGWLILEPQGRNTGPAVALAAVEVGGDNMLLVMPSDHVIADTPAFLEAVRSAIPIAKDGWLVTFGIRPERPETGYGYIRRGEEIAPGVHRALEFVEKPNPETAERYISEGCFDWNSGIFLLDTDTLLNEFARQAPDILEAVEQAINQAQSDGKESRPDASAFAAARSQSIDHAIMEHADRVAVVPVQMGWSDVGSWDAIYEIGQADGEGNVATGDVLALDTRNSLIRSDGPLVVAIGVEELVVVATPDAVLIAPRGQTQRVREAVDLLRARPRPDAP